jgi:DNA-binding protein YbaB
MKKKNQKIVTIQKKLLETSTKFYFLIFIIMFGKMKDLYNLQKQAKQMKKKLQKIHIEAEVNGVVVTLNGEMDLVDIQIPETALAQGAVHLSKDIQEAFAKAKKKAEQVAAEEMKSIMGDMPGGFPGMG